jgi:Mce-associated membrane protein
MSQIAEIVGSGSEKQPGNDRSRRRRVRRLANRMKKLSRGAIAFSVMTLLAMASVALAVTLFFLKYQPDHASALASAGPVLDAATSGTVAILSYSPDTLDRDFSSAKAHLTGDFLSYYSKFTEQIVTPAARQRSVKANAVVVRAAVSELYPNSAVVLVFVNQSTTSKDRPQPVLAPSSVLISLTKVGGQWLISSFDPV